MADIAPRCLRRFLVIFALVVVIGAVVGAVVTEASAREPV
jgi:hypothetical protein